MYFSQYGWMATLAGYQALSGMPQAESEARSLIPGFLLGGICLLRASSAGRVRRS